MRLDEYVERVDPGRSLRLRGTDIGLEQIVARYRAGYDATRIRQDFPALSFEQIYGAITYYLHNKADVDAYVRCIEEHEPIQVGDTYAHEKITAVIRAHEHEWAMR